MEQMNWSYKPINEIKNFKDLELEKQRLKLHQQFLGELLKQDKHILQKAIEPQNLFETMINSLLNKNNLSSKLLDFDKKGNVAFKIIRWVIAKFF